MEVDEEFVKALQSMSLEELDLFDDQIEHLFQKLIYQLKMQIQPENIWAEKDTSQSHILHTKVSKKVLMQISDRKNLVDQQIGHPLTVLFKMGLYKAVRNPDLLKLKFNE